MTDIQEAAHIIKDLTEKKHTIIRRCMTDYLIIKGQKRIAIAVLNILEMSLLIKLAKKQKKQSPTQPRKAVWSDE